MISFGKYRYIGKHNDNDDTSKYSYNEDHFRQLISNNSYIEAANYLSQFVFEDRDKEMQHLHNIDVLRRNGGIVNAVYSRVADERELNSIEFADKVGNPGWYNSMRYKKDAKGAYVYANDAAFAKDNPEAYNVDHYLKRIGSTPLHEATSLSITFSPEKIGWFEGITEWALGNNWYKRNDTDDLDVFYNNGGFSKEQLEASGVNIRKDDKTGKTTITFDKSNVKALDILSAIPERYFTSNMVDIEGYYNDEHGESHKIDEVADYNTLPRLNPNDTSDYDFFKYNYGRDKNDFKALNVQRANNIRNIINDAKNKRNKIFEKRELNDYEVSSTVFDLTTDRTDILNYMHKNGQISDAEYNRRMKDAKNLVGWFRAQSYLSGTYSNIKNEEYTDEHFESIGQDEWFQIKNALSEFDDKDIIIQGQTINGELGIRITLPQAQRKKRLATTEEGGFLKTDKRNIQLFIPASAIPGMLGELQNQIDNRTDLQAIQDYDDMVGYGVKKPLYNGETMYIDNVGNVVREYIDNNNEKHIIYDDKPDAKERAIMDLNQTRILEKGRYLKFQHMNNDGDINYVTYEEDAKRFAIMAGNSLINAPLKDFDNKSILKYNSDGTIDYGNLFDPTLDLSNYHYDVYREIMKIREIYDELMNEVYNYNVR